MKLKKRLIVSMSLLMALTVDGLAETRWPVTFLNPGINGMIEAGGFYYKVTDTQVETIENTDNTRERSYSESKSKPLFFGELSWTTQNSLSLYTSVESLGDVKNVKAGIVRTGFYNELQTFFQFIKERVLEDPYSNDQLYSLTWQDSWKATAALDGIASTNTGIWYSCNVLTVRDDAPAERNPELARDGFIHKAGTGYSFKAGHWVLEPSLEVSCGITEGEAGKYFGYGAGIDLERQGIRSILELTLAVEVDYYRSIHPVYKARQTDMLAEIKLSYTEMGLFNTENFYATCGTEFNILTTKNDYYERKTVNCFVLGGLRFD